MHVRSTLRNAAQTALQAAPAVAPQILISRRMPVEAKRLPVVVISTPEETSELSSMAAMGARPRLSRTVDLEISAFVAAGAGVDIDGIADDLAVKIEKRLATNAGFVATCDRATLIRTRISGPSGDADRALAQVNFTFRCVLRTTTDDPEARV